MEKSKLQVRLREDMSKHYLKQLRHHGSIPGSLYGKGKVTLSLEVPLPDLAQALRTEAGIHAVIDLKVNGAKRGEGGTAVIKSIQKDPLTRKVLHVDFQRVSLSDVVVTAVPVEMLGDAPGIREGGILELLMSEVEVKSRADHIPLHLNIDVSHLQVGQFIHASEIPLDEGIELASRPEDIVVALRIPHVHAEREEEVALEEGIAEVEGASTEPEAASE
jgi:large subunit ribosomal protein L25